MAPVELASEHTDKDGIDDIFFGAVNVSDIAALERNYPEFRAHRAPGGTRECTSPSICTRLKKISIHQGVQYKENYGDNNSMCLLVSLPSVRVEVFKSCHDHPTAGRLGYCRTLARIREKYAGPSFRSSFISSSGHATSVSNARNYR